MTPEEIRTARKTLGLTQTELAALMGFSRSQQISDAELGRRRLGGPAEVLLRLYLWLHEAGSKLPPGWPSINR